MTDPFAKVAAVAQLTSSGATDVAGQAAAGANPSEAAGTPVRGARKRIPMSIPQRKLEVPDLPGYHLHWFVDANVPRAIQGGYEFVDSNEMPINQHSIATSKDITGNADLGSRIRVVSGLNSDNTPSYLTLMKIPLEWYLEDKAVLDNRNADIMSAIFKKEEIMGSENVGSEDRKTRYVKEALFQRPVRK